MFKTLGRFNCRKRHYINNRERWSFAEVDTKLFGIMKNIFETADETAGEFAREGDLRLGANIAGFRRVADAMIDEGAV